MEPEAALGIASQIAVALAGFAGAVTAFRARSVDEWEAIDKFRLRLLLTNSILPLAYCLFALALLAISLLALVQRGFSNHKYRVRDYRRTLRLFVRFSREQRRLIVLPFTFSSSSARFRCFSKFIIS
jgi:Mn2+/Fe2+ NRAMP family transporter